MNFKLWDYVDVQEFADYAGISYIRALKFLQSDQRCEFYYYSEEEMLEVIAEMKKELKSDLIPQETLAGKIARETGLRLIGEPTHIGGNW